MITVGALEAKNRARAAAPVVFVVTRRRTASSDDAVRFVSAACRDLALEAVAVDVDEPDSAPLFHELGVGFVPEVLVVARGVVLERATVTSAQDACAVLAHALGWHRGPPGET
jgi:hypothetical protein